MNCTSRTYFETINNTKRIHVCSCANKDSGHNLILSPFKLFIYSTWKFGNQLICKLESNLRRFQERVREENERLLSRLIQISLRDPPQHHRATTRTNQDWSKNQKFHKIVQLFGLTNGWQPKNEGIVQQIVATHKIVLPTKLPPI